MTRAEYSEALDKLFAAETRAVVEKLWDEELSELEGTYSEELAGFYYRWLEELDRLELPEEVEGGEFLLAEDHAPTREELDYVRKLCLEGGIVPLEDRT